jgi:hypothetical protein
VCQFQDGPGSRKFQVGKSEKFRLVPTSAITAAGSTGRCNTIQCIDSTMLPRKNLSFWLYSLKSKPGLCSGLSNPSERFSLSFQCKVGSN